MRFPVLAAPRLKGVKIKIRNGVPNIVPPHSLINSILSGLPPMEGILICGPVTTPDAETTLAALREQAAPLFTFWAFDCLTTTPMPLLARLDVVRSYANASGEAVRPLVHELVKDEKQLNEYAASFTTLGFKNGIVTRDSEEYHAHHRR